MFMLRILKWYNRWAGCMSFIPKRSRFLAKHNQEHVIVPENIP